MYLRLTLNLLCTKHGLDLPILFSPYLSAQCWNNVLEPPHWINAVLGIEPGPCVYWASTLSSELHPQPQTKESLY